MSCSRLRASPRAFRHRGRVGGSSLLTPLIAVLTAALMAVIAQFALLAPHAKMVSALESLRLPLTSDARLRPFGACGDVCSVDRICRHIVLRDGLHDGSRVSKEVLAAAESCY